MDNVCKVKKYFALALDPVHVGTGGYRLGHVDNTILRDPPTNLPKIPGSSLSGVARAYIAMLQSRNGNSRLNCAGKGGEFGEDHCGQRDCPVCVPFGFSKGEASKSIHGMAQFFDAHILFYPLHSMVGPIWITSPNALMQAEMAAPDLPNDKATHTAPGLMAKWDGQKMISLGWMLVNDGKDDFKKEMVKISDPLIQSNKTIDAVLDRLVLVPDSIFSRLVNDHLEIRTSVAINPLTGAAEEGALFTFEAIPRSTVLYFDTAFNNPQYFQIDGVPLSKDIAWVRKQVESGFEFFSSLGVGGMNTRGMGRLQILNIEQQGGAGDE